MADAGQNYLEAGQFLGQQLGHAINRYHQEQEQLRAYDILFNEGSKIQIPDPKTPGKTIPLVSPQFADAYSRIRSEKGAHSVGKMAGLMELFDMSNKLPGQQAETQARTLENQRYPVATSTGQTVQATGAQALTYDLAKEKAGPTVGIDLGGGNRLQVPINSVLSHPDVWRAMTPQSAIDLNDQVRAATGITLPQIQNGWNKRIVNGRLSVDVPVQKVDSKGRPIPDQFEQVKNSMFGKPGDPYKTKTITKTQTYSVPQELVPGIVGVLGEHDIGGVEQLPTQQRGQQTAPSIIPNSVQSPAAAGGTVRVISPQGVPGYIPQANLQQALNAGYTQP